MKKLLLVKSSVRSGRNADKVLGLVQEELRNYPDFEVSIADFKEMPLPFFDSPHTPSSEDFAPTNPNVIQWTKMVDEADAVVLLTAEYNHSYTPIIKNAIDWLYKPWENKPVAFIGYGWVGGARAIKHLRDVFGSNINGSAIETEANLRFMKEISTEGEPLNDDAAAAITAVLEEVKQIVLELETQTA